MIKQRLSGRLVKHKLREVLTVEVLYRGKDIIRLSKFSNNRLIIAQISTYDKRLFARNLVWLHEIKITFFQMWNLLM
ncbi:11386_t:CDS:2 [Funneliformis geosporum]|uniref:11386_t:CDS:1 n=1 Tax=Funneliformis geosporum TaxID=1117311 RepID=A0A9W4ST46_9GLOM|nr:11386_t:CDS:2 [Funneliformis geosporum]